MSHGPPSCLRARFRERLVESSDFAKTGSRHAYGDTSDEDPAGENEAGDDGKGNDRADPSTTPEDRELSRNDGDDEAADLSADPEETERGENNGDDRDVVDSDLDDIAPPPIDATDRADAAYEAHD